MTALRVGSTTTAPKGGPDPDSLLFSRLTEEGKSRWEGR